MANRVVVHFSLILTCLLLPVPALENLYLPGTVSPGMAWFPLRQAAFPAAKSLADSLLFVYEQRGRVNKNSAANRLEGATEIPSYLAEALCGNRVGETGECYLDSKPLGTLTLQGFHLNWCDFYGALIETRYVAKSKLAVDQVTPGALFIKGPSAGRVKPFFLKRIETVREDSLKKFFKTLDPPPFDFIEDVQLRAFAYPGRGNRTLVEANFTTSRFAPGALFVLEGKSRDTKVVAQYYVGENTRIVQSLLDPGSVNPIILASTKGDGESWLVVHFKDREFQEIYRHKEPEFP